MHNYPYEYLFCVGFLFSFLFGFLVHHICGVFHIMSSDKDSLDWESK